MRSAPGAFEGALPDVKLDGVDIWPGFGYLDDRPVVDVSIIHDGKHEQLNDDGLLDVQTAIVDKAYRAVEEDLGFPASTASPSPS